MWDVTDTEVKTLCTLTISTHTSRVGCDAALPAAFVVSADFYSHIPCGMWQKMRNILVHIVRFLLTHPVWDVTFVQISLNLMTLISTHTSRVGCDPRSGRNSPHRIHFYSHIPCGMWQVYGYIFASIFWFLLTHPVWDVTPSATGIYKTDLFLLTHPVWDVTNSTLRTKN